MIDLEWKICSFSDSIARKKMGGKKAHSLHFPKRPSEFKLTHPSDEGISSNLIRIFLFLFFLKAII